MADVRPFRALRYSPEVDLSLAVCPPFDTISLEQQRELHQRSPHNAVRIELAEGEGVERYRRAADALSRWVQEGALRRDEEDGFYLYRQEFRHGGRTYVRTLLLARLRLEPWDAGVVLPHEQTFGAPKEDRLQLMRATGLNASPVFLIYRDQDGAVARLLEGERFAPVADFATADGQRHTLLRAADETTTTALTQAFGDRTLYIADGHHRYETALGFREERRAAAPDWTGEEPENFAMVALASAQDPGLLVLPIHRITKGDAPLEDALGRLRELFDVESFTGSPDQLTGAIAERGREGSSFGLAASGEAALFLLTVRDLEAVDRLLPRDRSPEWRRLDYAIANHVIMQHCLGLSSDQMSDYSAVWFTEDAREAVEQVRSGRARYAVLLNPVPVTGVLDVADAGERMPQKSTFFYPKVPTGLVFNLLED